MNTWWHDDLRDTADALTEPSIHRAPIPYWDKNKHRQIRHHQTVQPGLLTQLYQAVIPAASAPVDDAPGAAGHPESRPPLAIEALSAHAEIAGHIRAWCADYGLTLRPTGESNLRQLTAKAMSFDEPTARTLLADLRRWRRWCLVMTGWEKVTDLRGASCPECSTVGSVRVNLTTSSALCRACPATWSHEDGNLGALARHVVPGKQFFAA